MVKLQKKKKNLDFVLCNQIKKNINPYELNYNSILIKKKIFNLYLMKNRNSYFRDFERLLIVSGGCSFDGMGGRIFQI